MRLLFWESSDLLRHQHPAGACYPSETGGVAASAVKFLGVFAPTQLPLAVLEGILTVLIVIGMESFAAPELRAIGFFRKEKTNGRA